MNEKLTFEEMIHTISGFLDFCFDSGIEDFESCEIAETNLHLLVNLLADKGITNFDELKDLLYGMENVR